MITLLLAVLLWSLHLVCSQQVVSPVDRLSDIHPGSQTQSSNMAVHMAKIPAVFEIITNHQPTTQWLCIGFTYRMYLLKNGVKITVCTRPFPIIKTYVLYFSSMSSKIKILTLMSSSLAQPGWSIMALWKVHDDPLIPEKLVFLDRTYTSSSH